MAAVCVIAANVLRIYREHERVPQPCTPDRSTVAGARCAFARRTLAAGELAARARAVGPIARAGCAAACAHVSGAAKHLFGRSLGRRTSAEHRDARRAGRRSAARRACAVLRTSPAVFRAGRRVAKRSLAGLQRVVAGESGVRLDRPFSWSAPYSAHEFRRASQGLSSLEKTWLIGLGCLSEAE